MRKRNTRLRFLHPFSGERVMASKAKVPGLGRLPNKHFRRALGLAKMASVSTLALLAVSASPNFTWVHVRFAFQGHFRYNRFNGR